MDKYNVEVDIETEEGGCGFEETITTKKGKPIYTSRDMPIHKCRKCGNKQSISTNFDLENEVCCECDEYGFGDELEQLIKEKQELIEKENEKKTTKKI